MPEPGSESPPLPPIVDTLLDRATTRQLLVDLAALAGPIELAIKQNRRGHAAPSTCATPADLAAVETLLATGATAVQLRYEHEGRSWCDTLSPAGDRVRLIRIDVGAALAGLG